MAGGVRARLVGDRRAAVTSAASPPTTRLVGDIGGTHARFGLMSPDAKLLYSRTLADEDYSTIADALSAFLAGRGPLPMPRQGAIAIASAITSDHVAMTNHPWSFSIQALKSQLGFDRLEVINDFTALALALPHLAADERVKVGGGAAVAGAPIAVLGPGSGLGVSGLVPYGRIWIPLAGEGGHATLAPASDRESAVLDRMRRNFDHVSAERALSGPGLVNLYTTLAELDGVPAQEYTAGQITDLAIRGADPRCAEATSIFCAMLGTMAGNLALTLGARGGVYIGGGIVPQLRQTFAESPFRERFEAKGRLQAYLAEIPTFVVIHPLPAFLGCAALLAQ
jgi:glucokinase